MSGRAAARADAPEDLVDALSAAVAASGGSWFPEWGTDRVGVRFHSGTVRPRCFLYRFEVHSGQRTRPILVKVRHSQPGLRRLDRYEDRPVLAPVRTLSDEDTARREYEGLQLISDALRDADPRRCGVLRPLAWLPEQSAIVTDFVAQPTLRTVLLGTSRLHVGKRTALDDTPWRNAGAWLRAFHDHQTSSVLPARAETAEQVGLMYRDFAEFLGDRIGRRPVLDELSGAADELAHRALPADLPLGTGHGDFVANNMFTTPEGRITVFDPLPVWRLPVYQDLATLTVGLRVLPLQAATLGLALPQDRLDGYEAALFDGYFGADSVPRPALLAFQLLVLLDRWSARVSQRTRQRPGRRQLQEARAWVASRHYQEQARRILSELTGEPVHGGPSRGA